MVQTIYSKVNVLPTTNTVLKIISAKEHRPVYDIVEELLQKNYGEYYSYL